jgi:AraC-like DNA-binding protein
MHCATLHSWISHGGVPQARSKLQLKTRVVHLRNCFDKSNEWPQKIGKWHPKKQTQQGINWQAFEYYPTLKKVKTYVVEHPESSLTLTEAARIAAMESTRFSKFFHQRTGVSFKYWETLRKVERAVSFFDTTYASVTEAALHAGFNDLTTFERAFKRIKGITPRQYRKHSEAWILSLPKTA